MQIWKWIKTVWDLGVLQQAFVCLCIPRWLDRLRWGSNHRLLDPSLYQAKNFFWAQAKVNHYFILCLSQAHLVTKHSLLNQSLAQLEYPIWCWACAKQSYDFELVPILSQASQATTFCFTHLKHKPTCYTMKLDGESLVDNRPSTD